MSRAPRARSSPTNCYPDAPSFPGPQPRPGPQHHRPRDLHHPFARTAPATDRQSGRGVRGDVGANDGVVAGLHLQNIRAAVPSRARAGAIDGGSDETSSEHG
jgi:hypothetical protein